MTQEKKQQLKEILPTWLTLGNMILLIGLFYARGQTDEGMRKDIINNSKEIIEISRKIETHKSSAYEHRSMDDLMIKFVPREELKATLDNIVKSQDEIKQLIKEK
jgi:translation initiation factor 2B subunit (eIF-2B alpha/beta/delta family)